LSIQHTELEAETLHEIVANGLLQGYSVGAGFMNIHWASDKLQKGHYLQFKFTEIDGKLIGVKEVAPNYLPLKHRARTHAKRMEGMVLGLFNGSPSDSP